ncbi:TIGR03943 family putative permease subunit [Aeromicrobium sp. P5_D10]
MTLPDHDLHDHTHELSSTAHAERLRLLVLTAWALLFGWLYKSDGWQTYLAPRAAWLVPAAGIGFAVLSVGQAVLVVRHRRQRTGTRVRSDMVLTVSLLFPVLLVAIVSPQALTSYAVGMRGDFAVAEALRGSPLQPGEAPSFQQIVSAPADPETMAELRARGPEPVTLEGIVNDPTPSGFTMVRFIIGCCVVDATVAAIAIDGVQEVPKADTWVRVHGDLVVDDQGRLLITAVQVEEIDRPKEPYLSPQV